MENNLAKEVKPKSFEPLSARRAKLAAYSAGWKSPAKHTEKGADGVAHGKAVNISTDVQLEKKIGTYADATELTDLKKNVVRAAGESGQLEKAEIVLSTETPRGIRVGLVSGEKMTKRKVNGKQVNVWQRVLSGGFNKTTAEPMQPTGEPVHNMNFEMSVGGLIVPDANGRPLEADTNGKNAKGGADLLAKTKGVVGGVVVGDDPFQLNRPGGSKRIPANKAMMAYTGWVYAAVSAIAMDIATIEWRLFAVKGNDDHEEIFEHELLDLLGGVNEFQTGVELRFLMAAHLELTGNCYLLKLDKNKKPVSSDSVAPAMMYPLDPGGVTMVFDKSTFPYTVLKYVFTFDGQKHSYDPFQILHLKYPDPSDMFAGLGPVQTIAAWIDVDNYATEYNRRFFINGAHIDGVLQTDMTAEETIDVLRTSWENGQAGVENAHRTPVMPKGVKYVPTSASPKDMDFTNMDDKNRDKILAGMKVSKTILGTAESDTNRATAETADYVFAKRTIRPKMEIICAYLNEFLVPLFGDSIYLSYENPVPEDAEFRTKEMQAVMASAPVMSPNEARENYMGLGPVEGGDTVMTLTTLAPIGASRERSDGSGGGNDKPKEDDDSSDDDAEDGEDDDKDADGNKIVTAKVVTRKNVFPRGVVKRHMSVGGKKKTPGAQHAEFRRSLKSEFAARVAAALSTLKKIEKADINSLTHEEYGSVYKEFLSRVDPYEKKIDELLVTINGQQKKEVLENLAKIPGVKKDIAPDDIFNLKKWVQVTIDALTPVLTELGNKEGAAAAELVGHPLQENVFDEPAAQSALDESVRLLSNSYNETVLAALRSKLDAGISSGLSYDDLADSVSDIYAFQDEKAAARVARTESVRVANMTTKAAWKATGVVKTVKWYTADDGDVCSYCQETDGKEIDIDANFYNLGDDISGGEGVLSMTADYSDIGGPPLHPNCRCYIRPEVINSD